VPNGESPAFTPIPELSAGFDLLYEQKFAEARQIFANWESRNREDPFGEVAVAASEGVAWFTLIQPQAEQPDLIHARR
jgi:hypothetical protein